MAVLSLNNVKKSYKLGDGTEFPVLKGINVSFEKGELVSIIGESGSGKSTLMNIIGGLDSKFEGEVLVDGKNIGSFTEKELDQKVRELYAASGHSDVSFPPITAYGKSGADPHHATDSTLGKRGDSVVLDIGGIRNNYCSDMTRTVFLGEVSEKARKVYEIVREAQQRGIDAARPGARMCDVDNACRSYITEKGYGEFFTHRTGHSIGIEDHETGDVSSVNQSIIQPGQVFSIEPGIYLQEEGIGVRIEDLVLITEDGCEVLNHYPKDLIVVPMDSDSIEK